MATVVKMVKRGTRPEFVVDDGGRSEAGFKGGAGDCVTRAIAIAEGIDYSDVREELMERTKSFRENSRSRKAKRAKTNSVRNGTFPEVYRPYLESLGWERTPLVKFGSSDRKKLIKEELPKGNVIVEIPKHIMAVVDHVVHDTWDSRDSFVWVDGSPTNEKKPRTMVAFWTKKKGTENGD